MKLPYNRPRFIELHEQSWLPAYIRQPIQTMLTAVWITRFPILQSLAPFEAVSDVLERIINEIEEEDERFGEEDGTDDVGGLRIVDCCSGAGGPMPAIEKRLKWVSPLSPFISIRTLRKGP